MTSALLSNGWAGASGPSPHPAQAQPFTSPSQPNRSGNSVQAGKTVTLRSPSHDEPDYKHDEQYAADPASYRRAAVIISAADAKKKQQEQDDQDKDHKV